MSEPQSSLLLKKQLAGESYLWFIRIEKSIVVSASDVLDHTNHRPQGSSFDNHFCYFRKEYDLPRMLYKISHNYLTKLCGFTENQYLSWRYDCQPTKYRCQNFRRSWCIYGNNDDSLSQRARNYYNVLNIWIILLVSASSSSIRSMCFFQNWTKTLSKGFLLVW